MKRKLWICLAIWLIVSMLLAGCTPGEGSPKERPEGLVQAADSLDGCATVYVPAEREARVLLLADPQLDPTEKYSVVGSYNELTLVFLDKFLDAADPDLVIVAGDIAMTVLRNNWSYFCQIADIFEAKQIPWTFVFGNHDCEKEYVSKVAGTRSLLGQMSKPKLIRAVQEKYAYCLVYSGDCKDGYGNHIVNVRNTQGKLLHTFCNLDCVYDKDGYSHIITQAQTDYYEAAIEALCRQEGTIVPSSVVTHVALPQMFVGYREAQEGTGDSTICYGELLEGDYSGYIDQSPFFDALLRLGSTKSVFFGHHHVNDACVEYQGVRLSFIPHSGMSHEYRTDHSKNYLLSWPRDTVFDFSAIDTYGDHRGGILLTVQQDATYSFAPLCAAEVIPDYAQWAIDYDAVAQEIVRTRGEQYIIRGK